MAGEINVVQQGFNCRASKERWALVAREDGKPRNSKGTNAGGEAGDDFKAEAKRTLDAAHFGRIGLSRDASKLAEAVDEHQWAAWHPTGSEKGEAKEDGMPAQRSGCQSRGQWAPWQEPREKG